MSANAAQQSQRAAALGYKFGSIRFVWTTPDVKKNALALTDGELAELSAELAAVGVTPDVLCSPVGKCWISDQGGPPHAKYMTPAEVGEQLDNAIRVAKALNIRAVRVFGGYGHDWNETTGRPLALIEAATPLMKLISARLKHAGLLALLENEKYLSGWSPKTCVELIHRSGADNALLAFDPGNAQHVGFQGPAIGEELQYAIDAGLLGAFHLKECAGVPATVRSAEFDEHMLGPYHVVCGKGEAGVAGLFGRIRAGWEELYPARVLLAAHGFAGIPCMVEGHLKSGGPYGGSSGPEGIVEIRDTMSRIWSDQHFEMA